VNPYRSPESDLGQGSLITMTSLRLRAALLFSLPSTLLAIYIQGTWLSSSDGDYGIQYWEPTYTLLPVSLAYALVWFAISKQCVCETFWQLFGPSVIATPILSVVTASAFHLSLAPTVRWDQFLREAALLSVFLFPLVFLLCAVVRWYGRKHRLGAND
jgi:hypothetical protein